LSDRVVGVLETNKLPTPEVCRKIAEQCLVTPDHVILLAARTASIAGTVQVVARSVETALHKLHELGYDLKNVVSGFGSAPLPPVAADDLVGIGRTNDAILYGGQVTLWVRDDDTRLSEIGPQVPSNASRDFGEPFAAVFERSGRDFYKIDPLLFSPAVVTLVNLTSGRAHRFGQLQPDVFSKSFGS
jgi:methenyltetrahydromethanopterin cyclohydrolase